MITERTDSCASFSSRNARYTAILVQAVSALCRRAREREQQAPLLADILRTMRVWFEHGQSAFTQAKLEALFPAVLDVIEDTGGTLNYNDATLVVLQQPGNIGAVATFDANLASHPGFQSIA